MRRSCRSTSGNSSMRSVPAGGVHGDPDGGAMVVGSASVRIWGKSDSGAESDAGVGPVPDSVEEDATGGVVVVSDTTETSWFCDVRGLPLVEFTTKWGVHTKSCSVLPDQEVTCGAVGVQSATEDTLFSSPTLKSAAGLGTRRELRVYTHSRGHQVS